MTCPWCKDSFDLVVKGGHLTCPECRTHLVKKGEPDWDEAFGSRIGKDEYWMSPYYSKEPLVQIEKKGA